MSIIAHGFSLFRCTDARRLYSEDGLKMGILFKGRDHAYLTGSISTVTGDDIRKLMQDYDFDYYINLDGGSSSSFYVNGNYYLKHLPVVRKPHEAFYIRRKDDTTYSISINTNHYESVFIEAIKR